MSVISTERLSFDDILKIFFLKMDLQNSVF